MLLSTAMTPKVKQRMINAYWQLYQRDPRRRISVREIIARAHCNRSTFYRYFANVEDVLCNIEDLLIPDFQHPVVQKIIRDPDITISVDYCRSLYHENRQAYALLLSRRGDPSFRGKLREFFDRLIRCHLTDDTGTSEFERRLLAINTADIIINSLTTYYLSDPRPTAQEITQMIIDVLNHGVMGKLNWRPRKKTEE